MLYTIWTMAYYRPSTNTCRINECVNDQHPDAFSGQHNPPWVTFQRLHTQLSALLSPQPSPLMMPQLHTHTASTCKRPWWSPSWDPVILLGAPANGPCASSSFPSPYIWGVSVVGPGHLQWMILVLTHPCFLNASHFWAYLPNSHTQGLIAEDFLSAGALHGPTQVKPCSFRLGIKLPGKQPSGGRVGVGG